MGSRGSSSGARVIGRVNLVGGGASGRSVVAYNKLPKGWKYDPGATTAPRGYRWANNGKSRFGGEFKQALVKQ